MGCKSQSEIRGFLTVFIMGFSFSIKFRACKWLLSPAAQLVGSITNWGDPIYCKRE